MKNSPTFVLSFIAAFAIAATGVVAQTQTAPAQPPMDHSKMDHSKMDHSKMDHSKMDHSKMDHSKMGQASPASGAATDTASTKAFKAANDKMHGDMAIAFSGNADVDFIKGMLPHHQGAVDMAKIVLEHGKDPKVRKLARDIIRAQNTEIAFMKTWLAKTAK
jgi:uncharacterized protein (DUF305 family)